MKTENTIENKAQFLGHHIGCDIEWFRESDSQWMKATTLSDYINNIQNYVKKDCDEHILDHQFECLLYIRKYNTFWRQKPELWMFVACDADGNPMVEPDEKYSSNVDFYEEFEAYQTALSKVVFKGFYIEPTQNNGLVITNGCICVFWYDEIRGWHPSKATPTLESLIQFGVELTDEKAKEFKII